MAELISRNQHSLVRYSLINIKLEATMKASHLKEISTQRTAPIAPTGVNKRFYRTFNFNSQHPILSPSIGNQGWPRGQWMTPSPPHNVVSEAHPSDPMLAGFSSKKQGTEIVY